jgi:hypothetical protein
MHKEQDNQHSFTHGDGNRYNKMQPSLQVKVRNPPGEQRKGQKRGEHPIIEPLWNNSLSHQCLLYEIEKQIPVPGDKPDTIP